MPPRDTLNSPLATLKSQLGCWLNERWRTERAILFPVRYQWLDLCNRHETLAADVVSGGRVCQWRDSSQLTVARIFPHVGRRLLHQCLRQWPLQFNYDSPAERCDEPEASVLIAIGGRDRWSQFRTVLASLRGQSHGSVEILVVEQSVSPQLQKSLPSEIRYLHDRQEAEGEFNKSRALNVAARVARGKYFLIHDADYVVPRDYVSECCRVLKNVHGVRPSRFNFHLDERSTFEFTEARELPCRPCPEFIVQNNPTPMALRAESYWEIGGHDESFIGWGGEDVEFLSRLRTLSVCEGGWLPTIHLWHPPAPRKVSGHRNQQQQDEKLAVPAEERIRRLRKGSSENSLP
jgi:hypothetical protein